jgi:hypothetical protein
MRRKSIVAHALLRAASALMPTPVCRGYFKRSVLLAEKQNDKPSVGMSADAARKSACATAGGE